MHPPAVLCGFASVEREKMYPELSIHRFPLQINSVIRAADKSVSAEITVLANVSDNQAQYRCEASNSATEIPLFQSTMLSVHCEYTEKRD